MINSDLRYKIALSVLKGVNFEIATLLIDEYGSVEAIFDRESLTFRVGYTIIEKPIFNPQSKADALAYADNEITFITKYGIKALFFSDEEYPKRLLNCNDAPIILYYKGERRLESKHIVSIVGTRKATPYGCAFCEKIVGDLASQFPDIIIVSGLAYGIDITAHRAALSCGVNTVAVMGQPLNTIYPTAHRNCAKEIVQRGAIISEYSSGDSTFKRNFVARNRIVAGMCDATIVIESKDKGGSLITADLALGYNREVFALPGDINRDSSKGCNALIKSNKAQLITSADDIIDALFWERQSNTPDKQLQLFDFDEVELAILSVFDDCGEVALGEITATLNIDTPKIMSTLMNLEFKGVIGSFPGGRYRRI